MQHPNAANRLDRLPIGRFHKTMLVTLAFAYFFEFADINSFATTAPKLIKLWGLTVNQIAYVTSLSFAGMFVGSVVAGWIADRWGRKRALAMTTLFFSVFSLLSAFTWDVVSLGVCRVLTSAGLSAMTVVGVIYLNEMFPAAVRGKYQAYAIVIGICGTPATNLLASAIVPPQARRAVCAMASPRPLPVRPLRAALPRRNLMPALASSASAMPGPSSRI